jgi:hypothetical protein
MRRRRTKNKRLARALEEHEAWLHEMGVRPSIPRDAARWRGDYHASLRQGVAPPPVHDRVALAGGGGTPNRSLMSRLHLEPEHVRREIERKARSVAPLYNKGGLQYDGH